VTRSRKGGVRRARGVLFRRMRWGENAEKREMVSPRLHVSVVGNTLLFRSIKESLKEIGSRKPMCRAYAVGFAFIPASRDSDLRWS
jgi:hypothetical protein